VRLTFCCCRSIDEKETSHSFFVTGFVLAVVLFIFFLFSTICIVFHSTLKCAEQDLSNLRKTIEAMPLTFDQYKEQEAELVDFLANSSNPVDWNQRGLAAQTVVCEFDNSASIEKAVKVGLKFVSAEEEAAQRKADLEALMARRNESAAVVEGEFAFAWLY